MHPKLEALLLLQNRDQNLKALRAEERALPIERKQIEERIEGERARVTVSRDAVRALEVERKSLELEVQAKQDSIGKFKAQQAQTRRNEEFQALSNEIERYGKIISDIEDRELEVLERTDVARAELAAAEQKLAAAEKETGAALGVLSERAAALATRIAEVEADRQRIAADIESELLQRYNRLFSSKGDAAVVPVEHEVCMGCHMKVTTQTVVRARGGAEITNCPQCGRMLYCES